MLSGDFLVLQDCVFCSVIRGREISLQKVININEAQGISWMPPDSFLLGGGLGTRLSIRCESCSHKFHMMKFHIFMTTDQCACRCTE